MPCRRRQATHVEPPRSDAVPSFPAKHRGEPLKAPSRPLAHRIAFDDDANCVIEATLPASSSSRRAKQLQPIAPPAAAPSVDARADLDDVDVDDDASSSLASPNQPQLIPAGSFVSPLIVIPARAAARGGSGGDDTSPFSQGESEPHGRASSAFRSSDVAVLPFDGTSLEFVANSNTYGRHPSDRNHAHEAVFGSSSTSISHGAAAAAPPAVLTRESLFRSQWSMTVARTTSCYLFAATAFLGYCLYRLASPYLAGISSGILLSMVLHPNSAAKRHHELHLRACAELMRLHNQSWATTPWYVRVFGNLASLWYFVLFVLMSGVYFLGLEKLTWGHDEDGSRRGVIDSKFGRDCLRLMCAAVFVTTCAMMVGVVPLMVVHACLFAVFAVSVQLPTFFFPDEVSYVRVMGRLWRTVFLLFLLVALAVNFFSDVIVITTTVGTTTQFVVQSSQSIVATAEANWTAMFVQQAQAKIMSDVARALDAANLTDTAIHVHTLFGPLLQNVTAFDFDSVQSVISQVPQHVRFALNGGIPSDVGAMLGVVQRLFDHFSANWMPVWEVGKSAVLWSLRNVVGGVDAMYELVLFVCVYNFLVDRKHTVVYYAIYKALAPMDTHIAHRQAEAIEVDITDSLGTLLRSFWHVTWLHFSVTFCVFKQCDVPLPFFSGLFAVAMALFPLAPKWVNLCFARMLYRIWQLSVASRGVNDAASTASREGYPHVDMELVAVTVGWVLMFKDDWLVSVSRGLQRRKEGRAGAAAGKRSSGKRSSRSRKAPLPISSPPSAKEASGGETRLENIRSSKARATISPSLVTEAVSQKRRLIEADDDTDYLHKRSEANPEEEDLVGDDENPERQLPKFIVGTSIILGLVVFGLRGVVFGPLIVISARVMYDYWEMPLMVVKVSSGRSSVAKALPTAAAHLSTTGGGRGDSLTRET